MSEMKGDGEMECSPSFQTTQVQVHPCDTTNNYIIVVKILQKGFSLFLDAFGFIVLYFIRVLTHWPCYMINGHLKYYTGRITTFYMGIETTITKLIIIIKISSSIIELNLL